ncbi:hypothetical protein AOL_s00078g340 [Orbilia oligospora ATCC 24927]|uniref:Uncharacterized protein n=1 Tax=Arthrobotrys oligospora (strain ATCC 24927 / CBS 115.81 / DSM 1491) TaxID=756982 RepID=G1XBP3_ARTOA|nr:hypothetical protein AOL_s00078g340 [Orbilia oligospora ATCC 24927]EGX49307.1 hypothetical protein AOL_s00078g340 [Orbilia oligospora ATCC 24927]
MPRPTQRISSLPPFSHHARQSLDDSSLPTLPHPPSPPSDPTFSGITNGGFNSNFHRYSTIPLISSVAAEPESDGETESFSYMNNLNTGVYNSLSRIPSYRLPSPVSLPSRHNSRIQRDRGMSASPVSSISAVDAPITNRYSYLIQPSVGMSQNPTSSDISYPSLPSSQDQNPVALTMGLPQNVDSYNQAQTSRFQGQLTTINESTTNLPGTSNQRPGSQSTSQPQYAIPPPSPPPALTVTYDIPPRPQFSSADNTLPAPPPSTFQRLRSAAHSRFGRIPNVFIHQGPPRPLSLSYLLRRRRPSNHPPTPALAIVGLVTSILVFISLMTFLWVSTFAANIVAIVYAFSVLVACTWVLVDYNQKKMRARIDEEAGGSRSSLFTGSGTRQEMDMVQESEIIVIPRMPVHRVVGEGEADPELPPYTRGDAAEILDIPVPPPPNP